MSTREIAFRHLGKLLPTVVPASKRREIQQRVIRFLGKDGPKCSSPREILLDENATVIPLKPFFAPMANVLFGSEIIAKLDNSTQAEILFSSLTLVRIMLRKPFPKGFGSRSNNKDYRDKLTQAVESTWQAMQEVQRLHGEYPFKLSEHANKKRQLEIDQATLIIQRLYVSHQIYLSTFEGQKCQDQLTFLTFCHLPERLNMINIHFKFVSAIEKDLLSMGFEVTNTARQIRDRISAKNRRSKNGRYLG